MNRTDITFALSEKIEKASHDFGLLERNCHVLAALSGGADSCAMLILLKGLSETIGFELAALHINHMIRGEEADRDEEFARQLCKKYGVQFFSVSVDIPSLAKKRCESDELCARNERYRIFRKVCESHGFDRVATAHTSSDNAETVLFNLARGSGIRGLCGIPAARKLSDSVKIVRPLLYVTRGEIEQFLESLGQDFMTDSTNLTDDYTRNFVRHRLVPLFKTINPSFEAAVSRSSQLLDADRRYIDTAACNSVTDDIGKLAAMHESIRSRIIERLYADVCGETLANINVSLVSHRIREAARVKGCVCDVSLPGKVKAHIENGRISFVKNLASEASEYSIKALYGDNVVAKGKYVVRITREDNNYLPGVLNLNEIIYKKYKTEYIYSDRIMDNVTIRTRLGGDVLFQNGMNKSVKRLMCEKKIPVDERNELPFICDENGIICIPGVGVSDGYSNKVCVDKKTCVALYKQSI